MNTAVISGICGMDGSHLCDLLLDKDYKVIGFYRRSSIDKLDRIRDNIGHENLVLEEGDLCDASYINRLLSSYQPDVFFNTAAQSHVGTSFSQPQLTIDVNLKGVANILEAIRNYSPKTRLIQCSTSEMWGNNIDPDNMQRETTPFAPRSPYAVSKMAAFNLCATYRAAYGLFACSSICHNHTGPRRGDNFVEKKIINWVVNNHQDLKDCLNPMLDKNGVVTSDSNSSMDFFGVPNKITFAGLGLGNIDTYRDFGHSKDYVRAMLMMSEAPEPKDYVIATGVATSIRGILQKVFSLYNKDYRDFVYTDPKFFRPAEVDFLCGDPSLIKKDLGWEPEYTIDDILKEMLQDGLKQRT